MGDMVGRTGDASPAVATPLGEPTYTAATYSIEEEVTGAGKLSQRQRFETLSDSYKITVTVKLGKQWQI